jgi:hypothetical protein
MSNATQTIAVRLEGGLVALVDRIAAELSERAAGVNVTRSDAIRVLIERGARAIEGDKKPKR